MTRHEREFRFLGFRVAVPKPILKDWAALPTDKVCRIIDSVRVVYAKGNLKWESARAEPSVVARELATGEQAPTALQLYHAELKHQVFTRKKLTGTEAKERVLWLLQFQGYRDLNRSPIAAAFWHAVTVAVSDGDEHLFRALGERVKEKPIPYKPPRESSPPAGLLLEHWIVKKGICFCWFSNRALSDFLKQTQKSYYAPDAIRKAYERLGLRKLRQPLVREIEVAGKRIRLRG
jgi:hypothetical protein